MWDQRTKGYIPQISLFFNKNIQNEPDKNDVTMKSRVNEGNRIEGIAIAGQPFDSDLEPEFLIGYMKT